MKAFDYGPALDRLSLAREKNPNPDYRYYYILGETYYRMGKMSLSMQAFQKSLDQEPGQVELLLKIAEFQESDRRPHIALEYLKKYLRFLPNDKDKIYRAAILAKLSGENRYAEQLLSRLESDKKYQFEKEAILERIRNLIFDKKWEKAIADSRKFLLHFPREEILHEYLILAMRGFQDPNTEKAIIDSAALFSRNSNFAVRYGIFLQENERMLEALSAFRRAFQISLLQNQDPNSQKEIFFLIRQTYGFLEREHDARALAHLSRIIQDDKANDEIVLQATKTYPDNRETLVYAIHHFEIRNHQSLVAKFQKELKERDVSHEESELFFVIGPFPRETLE